MTFIHYKAFRFFRGAFLFAMLNLFQHLLPAQELPQKISIKAEQQTFYDNDLLPKEFHSGRRDALRKLMADSSVAVFFSATIKNYANDVNYEFHQEPNFYYLTGLKEPEAMLIVFKNDVHLGDMYGNEFIFVQDRDPKSERWTGKLTGVDGAKNILGIQNAHSNNVEGIKFDFSKYKKIYCFKSDEKTIYKDLPKSISSNPVADTYAAKDIMATLREIKTKEELDLMRKAINITCDAIREAIKALEPGMKEYDAEAIVEYVFKSKGSEREGYPSIVGGGENSCILHYETNRKKLTSKDMLVCDVGAEYHGYTADVTRTMPVSGKFSAEQKAIYNIVLEAQTAGIDTCKPGADFRAPHKAATAIIQKRLLELGVIKQPNEVGKYFFHGTSHYLGLDVHDQGIYGKLKPNSVITVEPGIYIPFGSDCDEKWWGIGIRIEDDVLITETKPEVLSSCVPKTIEEIETLMKQESLFNHIKK